MPPVDDHPRRVSLTTDVGEGFGHWRIADDEALLRQVTGANVACGFHAGDPDIMRHTCETAAANAVSIGAQVSYRDLVGFGRRYIAVPVETLTNDLVYQMGALDAFARLAGTRISYVRAHGALYNVAARDRDHATALVDAVWRYDPSLPLLCQTGTATWKIARQRSITTIAEAFVDRAYTRDGLLLPRGHPEALLTDPTKAAERAVQLATAGKITSVDGIEIQVAVDSLLVHSDTPRAVEIASATRQALQAADVELVSVA